jgi:Glycosyl transferase family 2
MKSDQRPMQLTVLVLAINAEQELPRMLPSLLDIGDELVVGIDDTTTDGTAEVARRFTDRIYPVAHAGFMGRGGDDDLNAVECMLPHCRGEWVLRVDQDETLSSLWHDRGYVARLLGDRYATHYWIPRRWAVPPGDSFIASHHWYPDYQLRLFRNIPSLVSFNRTPHRPPFVAGEVRYLTDSWIMHWDYVWHDRRTRAAKVEFYRELGTYTGEEFYLYEDRSYLTRPLVYAYNPAAVPQNGADATGGGRFDATVEIVDCPETLPAGETAAVALRITNRSNRIFRPDSPHLCPPNVLAAYHWSGRDGRSTQELYEGTRHSMPKRLAPGESSLLFLRVKAPDEAGDYLWQPDLVEEGVAWFSSHCAMPTCAVRVTALRARSTVA